MKKIQIALAGNPNCGKTTLFNQLTGSRQHVGNWPGVTVEKKTGFFHYKDLEIELIDLPGTYSLSPNSIEEILTRDFIVNDKPDFVLNIVDGTTLERSLYLTTELIDTGTNLVLAVNMMDEVAKKGIEIDFITLENLLGVPVMPINAKKEEGITQLLDKLYESAFKTSTAHSVNYGEDIEASIEAIGCQISCLEELTAHFNPRWLAIRLITGDKYIAQAVRRDKAYATLNQLTAKQIVHLKTLYEDDLDMVMTEKRFGFIMGIVRECVVVRKKDFSRLDTTEKIDNILLNRFISFPIFALILWSTFQLTFSLGGIASGWIEELVNLLSLLVHRLMPVGPLKDLLIGGVLSGVGGILVFLPQILILFLIIAILEDSGYMARVAFIMDRMMHFLGIHGKSFISLFMGIGCNVPGIMAARTLENEEDRKVTVLINPFMSCSARLPIYVLIAGAFFGQNAGTVIFWLYIIGVLVAIMTAKLLKTFFFKGKSVPFVMELPPYRSPTVKSLLIHMWERASQFLSKMGGIILVGSLIIWALSYYPRISQYSGKVTALESQLSTALNDDEKTAYTKLLEDQKSLEQIEYSAIGRLGKAVEPFFKPIGFSWKEGVALITGVVAKEIVVSTLSVLYNTSSDSEIKLKKEMSNSGMNPAAAFSFMIFTLLYIPCLATIAAVLRETRSVRWTLFSIFYGIAIGYALSFISNILGRAILGI